MTAVIWWTVQNTLTVAALTPAVWLACRCLSSRPAVQHLLWLLLLVKLVVPPIVDWPWTLSIAEQPSTPPPQTMVAAADEAPSTPVNAEWTPDTEIDILALEALNPIEREDELLAEPPAPVAVTPPVLELPKVALAAWALGAIAMLAFTARALGSQRSVLRSSRLPSAQLRAAICRAAERLRVRSPGAAVSDRVESPVVACLPRPKLIWPEALDEPDAIAASDGILAHELAHIARRDHLVVWFETLILVFHWWNPVAWYVRRRLRETRELACDALALAHAEQSRGDYARRLLALSIARDKAPHFAPAFGAGTFSRRFLQRRLTMIFDSRTNGRLSAGGTLAAALLAAVALPGFARAFQADNAPVAANNPATTTTATIADAPPSPDADPTAYVTKTDTVSAADSAPATTSSITTAIPPRAVNAPVDPTQTTLTLDAPQENVAQVVSLPHGGSMEISQQGHHLRLAIRQPDGTSQVIVYKLTNENLTRHKAKVWQPVQDYVEGPHATTAQAVPATPRQDVFTAEADSVPAVAAQWAPAAAEDIEMLQADLELAEVNLQEKRVELESLRADMNNVPSAHSPSKLQLAKLAVRRAEIEVHRSALKLKRASSAPTAAPAATLDPNIQTN